MQISTLKKLAFYLGQDLALDRPITGFSVDSRTIEPGMVYCALRGEKSDGHQYIEEVFQKGAAACIADQETHASGPILVVPDVITALQELAKKVISERKRTVIAVTGSVGKTSVKEMIFQLLNPSLMPFKTPGNSNSQVGLPLGILNGLHENHGVAVLEMGMSKPSEIARLVRIAPPHVALINTVGYCHAEFFPDLSAIARAKEEIFSHPDTKRRLFHTEIQKILPEIVRNGAESFGLNDPSLNYSLNNLDGEFSFKTHAQEYRLPSLPSSLKPYAHNLLASLSAIDAAGFELWDSIERIHDLKLPEKRFQILEKKGVIIINDSYNACPLSMKAALTSIPSPRNEGKRIAVLGQMAELGRFSVQCHQEVAACALDHIDRLICYGKETLPMVDAWKEKGREVDYFDRFDSMVKRVREVTCPDDVLLIKGSNSNQLWKLIDEFES